LLEALQQRGLHQTLTGLAWPFHRKPARAGTSEDRQQPRYSGQARSDGHTSPASALTIFESDGRELLSLELTKSHDFTSLLFRD